MDRETETEVRKVFDKVVAYKRKQFSYDYPSSDMGKKIVRREVLHICHVLFPWLPEGELTSKVTEFIGQSLAK